MLNNEELLNYDYTKMREWRFRSVTADVERKKLNKYGEDLFELVRDIIDEHESNGEPYEVLKEQCELDPVCINYDVYHKNYKVHVEWLELADVYYDEESEEVDIDYVEVVYPAI